MCRCSRSAIPHIPHFPRFPHSDKARDYCRCSSGRCLRPLRARSRKKRSQSVRYAKAALTHCGSVLRGTMRPSELHLWQLHCETVPSAPKRSSHRLAAVPRPGSAGYVCERLYPNGREYQFQGGCQKVVSLRLVNPHPAQLAPSRPIKENRLRDSCRPRAAAACRCPFHRTPEAGKRLALRSPLTPEGEDKRPGDGVPVQP